MKLTPLMIITFIGLVSLMVQWSKHHDLKAQISKARSPENLSSSSLSRGEREGPDTSSKTSEMRVQLRDYLTMENSSVTLTSILSSATAADLLPLIEEYREALDADPNNRSKIVTIYHALGGFYSRLDPIGTLQAEDHLASFEKGAFTALSRKSPAKAMAWLESSALPEEARDRYLKRFHKIQILRNPAEHLDAWRKHLRFDKTSVPVIEPSGITDLLPKITDPENNDIRKSLITSVLVSSLLEGQGLARSRIESLGLETEEIISSLETSEDFACREILDWAIDLAGNTPEKTLALSEGFMATFAQKDLTAAADWLDQFQGHPAVKDQLTARYAMVLGATDPEAAQPWIAKIQDEKERNIVFLNASYQWKENDPQGFAEWQKRRSSE